LEVETDTGMETAGAMQRLRDLPRTLFGMRLYANAFYLWVNGIVTSVSGFIFWIVAARLYDAEDVGLAAAAVAALMLLGVVSNLGLGLGLIRFLPEAGNRAVSLLNGSFTLGAFAATVIAIVFLLGIPLWSPSLAFLREQPLQFVLYTLFAMCVTVGTIQRLAFMAVRRAEFALFANAGASVLKICAAVALAMFSAPFSIVGAWGIAPIVSMLAVSFWFLRRAHPSYRPAIRVRNWPSFDILSYSFGNYVSTLLFMAPGFLLPIMVVSQVGGEGGAYFYVAWVAGTLLTSMAYSLSLSLFSEGSHYRDGLGQGLWQALGTALVVSAVGAVLLLLAADKLLLAFGSDYAREAAGLLRLLALAALPACVTNLYLGVERVRKGIRRLILITLVVAGITLGGSYVLLQSQGIEGVGIAWLAAQCVGAAMATGQYLFERRRLIRTLRPRIPQLS
jgi:O-antigen/teichoic acid export membrane protein